ncbi:hypothetical protein [Candidatus Magnetominusculus xianensis]|uniref:Membrane protein n=1 Tax=Candidatus Magnetominusculus xianensis TaxID=1748249 RepID=A0ABR5SE09_9BACT|nr:hypothetical protein [Candidatus Magnetominusculus xianensis]KWT81138.1 membrane protein [Candidatus Magnetominusculus xianensis]MBF0402968.1 hypothetical protein [Nitrospirota bacterium]
MKLGNLDLPDDLFWENEYGAKPVIAVTEITVSGEPVTFQQGNQAGMDIDLTAGESYGWLSRAQVEALKEMEAALGAVYLLEIGGQQKTVRLRHEDAPAVEASPLMPLAPGQYSVNDYYTGRIKLKEV